MERKIEYRQLVNILALFLIVQLLGLLVTFYFLLPTQVSTTVQTSASTSMAGQIFIFPLYIVLGTIILLAIFKFYHGDLLFRLMEGIVVVSSAFYLFLIIFSSLFPQQSATYPVLAASLIIPILLVIAKNKRPSLRNHIAIIASAGAGIILGTFFSFIIAYAFMAVLALYDYIAVFVTKHMLTLGREAVERNLALLVGSSEIEMVPNSYISKKDLKMLKKQIAQQHIKNKEIRALMRQGSVPLPTQAALGTGDLAMPLMLSVSAFMTYLNFFTSIVIVIGASFGLIFTMFMLKKYKVALPAIPPLFSFINIALSVYFLAQGMSPYLSLSMLLIGICVLAIMITTARATMNENEKKKVKGIFS